jgi:hypothetical protein
MTQYFLESLMMADRFAGFTGRADRAALDTSLRKSHLLFLEESWGGHQIQIGMNRVPGASR